MSNFSPKKSLKNRLAVQFSVFVALVMTAVTILVVVILKDELELEKRQSLESHTVSEMLRLEQRLRYLVENTERLTSNPFVINGLVDDVGRNSYLPKMISNFATDRDVRSFSLVDFDGLPVFSDMDQVPNYQHSASLRRALSMGRTTLEVDPTNHQLLVFSAIQYYQTTQGAVVVAFDLPAISEKIFSNNTHHIYRLFIANHKGIGFGDQADLDLLTVRIQADKRAPILSSLDAQIQVGVPAHLHLQQVENTLYRFIGLAVLVTLAAVAVAVFIGNSIAKPIVTLCERVENPPPDRAGECITISPIGTDDELESLAQSFDARTAELQQIHAELEQRVEARTAELDRSQRFLKTVIDTIPVRVFWKDLNSVYLGGNTSCAHDAGLSSPDELIGKRDDQLSWHAESAAYNADDQAVISNKEPKLHYEEPRITPDGKTIWLSTSKIPLTNSDGAVIGVLGTYEDITERRAAAANLKRAKEDAEQAKEEAEKANRSKSEFLANMSHEIRTPLNAVINLSYLVQQTELDSKQHDYLRKIQNSGKTLLGIINDILDVSKVEANRLVLEVVSFNLEDLLENLANIVSIKVDSKELEVLFDIDSAIPRYLLGDPLRLEQILTNLLGNAIKFTEQGQVILSITPIEREEDKITLDFSITDSGIGMSEDQLEKLFQPFTQADGSTSRKYGGTGLGLTISRQLAKLMDGEITVESQIDQGSTFTLRASFDIDHNERRQSVRLPDDLTNMSLMVVDDSAVTRTVMNKTLDALGFTVSVASTGQEALEHISNKNSLQSDSPIQVVFLDWNLPDMDGVKVAQKIHTNSKLTLKPRIIVLTAYDLETVRNMAEQVQIDAFLIKPANPALLIETIMSVLSYPDQRKKLRHITSIQQQLDTIENRRGASVLLAEDNEINQQIVVELLNKANINVTVANNGKEAYHAMQQAEFDLVFMDIQMPEWSGYQAVEAIRNHAEWDDVPIIAMTAHTMQSEQAACLKAGMNGHLGKPLVPEQLYDTLKKWIKPKATPQPTAQISTNTQDAKPVIQFTEDRPGLSIQTGILRLGGNSDLYLQLLKKFHDNNCQTVEQIEKTLNNQNWEEARQRVHSIRGVAGNIGATTLFETGQTLETALKSPDQNDPMAQSAPFIHAMNETLESIQSLLNESSGHSEQHFSQDAPKHTIDLDQVSPLLQSIYHKLEQDLGVALSQVDQLHTLLEQTSLEKESQKLEHSLSDFELESARTILIQMADTLDLSLDVNQS
ncbi:MAG: response regulator [Magnetococcales bacterium]|nr:response regulator [Magnetococcales bacterium]